MNEDIDIEDIFYSEDPDKEEYYDLPPLVEEVDESVSTDKISDIKSGIYNLFISLINQNVPYYGPLISTQLALAYLQEIIDNVNHALKEE